MAYVNKAFSCQGKQINEPHHAGPGFLDLNLTIPAVLISQQQSREMIDALGIPVADGPGDILRNGSAFFLGERAHQGDKELAGAVHGVNILFANCNNKLSYILPTAGRIRDFHPLERALTGRTNTSPARTLVRAGD